MLKQYPFKFLANLKPHPKPKYAFSGYYYSPGWIKKKKEALKAADYQCQWDGCKCYDPRLLVVHHLHYFNVDWNCSGQEMLSDLVVLCKPHHAVVHTCHRCGKYPLGIADINGPGGDMRLCEDCYIDYQIHMHQGFVRCPSDLPGTS